MAFLRKHFNLWLLSILLLFECRISEVVDQAFTADQLEETGLTGGVCGVCGGGGGMYFCLNRGREQHTEMTYTFLLTHFFF